MANFTGYMGIVYGRVRRGPARQRILHIPAGNGLLAGQLRQDGYEVVCADINRQQPDYVVADLNATLPFPEDGFDTVLCLEGD